MRREDSFNSPQHMGDPIRIHKSHSISSIITGAMIVFIPLLLATGSAAFTTPAASSSSSITIIAHERTPRPHFPFSTTALSSSSRNGANDSGVVCQISEEFGDLYSRDLSPDEERAAVTSETRKYSIVDSSPRWQRALRRAGRPVTKLSKAASAAIGRGGRARRPGSLILLRCGESEWAKSGRFTGWADPDLIQDGVNEIEHAGR